jgi:formylglycine-generating enzyme required for sulfatase activity
MQLRTIAILVLLFESFSTALFADPIQAPAPIQAADPIQEALKPVTSELVARLKTRKQSAVSIGSFTGSGQLEASLGPGIRNTVAALLNEEEPGIVQDNAQYSVSGHFEAANVPASAGSSETKPSIRFSAQLKDNDGLLVDGAIIAKIIDSDTVFKLLYPRGKRPTAQPAPHLISPFSASEAQHSQDLWAAKLGNSNRLQTNSIGMTLALIPPGKFATDSIPHVLPNEKRPPKQEFVIAEPFRIAATEVTQKQWFEVMKTQPWADDPSVKQGDEFAAVHISWDDAVEFCRQLTNLERSKGDTETYRLPTEAEWEWACRAGTTGILNFDELKFPLSDFEWSNREEIQGVQIVAKKRPNAFGLYDTLSNAQEWCFDQPKTSVVNFSQISQPRTDFPRLARGGCWQFSPRKITIAEGRRNSRENDEIGFRPLKTR